MSSSRTYRIDSPTMALVREGNLQVARTVPRGSIIAALDALAIKGLINVTWDGKQVMMFAQDIRLRGHRLS